MPKLKNLSLIEVINDPSSKVKLQCTRGYGGIVAIGKGTGHWVRYQYKKGEVLVRSSIFLRPGHWKIAAKKLQKQHCKTDYNTYKNDNKQRRSSMEP